DGIVGVAIFLGGGSIPHRAIVQIGGNALKMPARVLQEEFARGGRLQHILLRYTHSLIIQISQTAVCNRLHSVEQRLCRWLLMTRDRTGSDELQMTHEFISNMLGVRREGVTLAAQRLQELGMISYIRGHIIILNRHQLLKRVCECYQVVNDEH